PRPTSSPARAPPVAARIAHSLHGPTGVECQDDRREWGVRLTIVGRSPSWPDAGGACSGYLIEERGYRLLLDCGPGVFAKLRQVIDYLELDAVLISHMHGDHFL